jgi:hypothetical protein
MTMTYGQLKQAVQDYTENDETSFVNNIPLFIRLAEERILKSVRLNLFQKNQFGNMSSGNKYLAAPSDFLAPFSLSLTDGSSDIQFLEFKNLDFVQTYNPMLLSRGRRSIMRSLTSTTLFWPRRLMRAMSWTSTTCTARPA